MIRRLVQSAFQTGYLSVESEGLIRQMLTIRSYALADLEALEELQTAILIGRIQREAKGAIALLPEFRGSSQSRPASGDPYSV